MKSMEIKLILTPELKESLNRLEVLLGVVAEKLAKIESTLTPETKRQIRTLGQSFSGDIFRGMFTPLSGDPRWDGDSADPVADLFRYREISRQPAPTVPLTCSACGLVTNFSLSASLSKPPCPLCNGKSMTPHLEVPR